MAVSDRNAYSVLTIKKGASEEEIKRAYIQQVKKYDPEHHTERFKIIQNAYERLKDPQKRAREDLFTYNFVSGEFVFSNEEKNSSSEVELIERIKVLEGTLRDDESETETKSELILDLMKKSWHNVRKKLWVEATRDWTKVLRLDSSHVRAKNNLVYCYITLGYSYAMHNLLKESIDLWEKALQMNPDNMNLIHNLAIVCEQNADKEKADKYWAETLSRWKAMLDKNPDDTYLKSCIVELHKHHGGKLLDAKKDSKIALDEYREILKINPDDFDAQFQIAATLMEDQKWREAVSELEKIQKSYPKNVEVLNLLGWALLNSGKVDRSFLMWKRSLTIEPNNAGTKDNIVRAHLSLGKKLREKGLYTPALVHLKALIKYLPRSPEVHFEIAHTYLLKGDQKPAANEFDTVLRIDPKNKLAKKALSEIKMRR